MGNSSFDLVHSKEVSPNFSQSKKQKKNGTRKNDPSCVTSSINRVSSQSFLQSQTACLFGKPQLTSPQVPVDFDVQLVPSATWPLQNLGFTKHLQILRVYALICFLQVFFTPSHTVREVMFDWPTGLLSNAQPQSGEGGM